MMTYSYNTLDLQRHTATVPCIYKEIQLQYLVDIALPNFYDAVRIKFELPPSFSAINFIDRWIVHERLQQIEKMKKVVNKCLSLCRWRISKTTNAFFKQKLSNSCTIMKEKIILMIIIFRKLFYHKFLAIKNTGKKLVFIKI